LTSTIARSFPKLYFFHPAGWIVHTGDKYNQVQPAEIRNDPAQKFWNFFNLNHIMNIGKCTLFSGCAVDLVTN